jgi:superfamily I DNA and/or RNA helicase
MLRLPADQAIDLHELSFLNKENSFSIINALIAGKEKKLCQVLDSRLEANNESSKKLKKLQRTDRFLFEERGSNDLHIGWPFLRGKLSDGTLVRCPLLFFPVTLVQENNQWILQPREDAGVTLNKSFLLGYAFYNKITIAEDLLETNFDDFSADSTVFRTELYQLLKDRIELNFNADNFRDELINFEQFKKNDFEKSQRNGELKLFPEAVLGIFPQAGSQLVPDYLQLIEEDNIADLEDFFVNKNHSENVLPIDHPVKEEKIFAPFRLDAYQERAIKAIKNGHSIVVQGPPGTGKSQLICNLMADGIASGKRVLLVCQKRAALDVVYERLKEIDLSDFLGLVHDFRNDRREIFAKICKQIERIDEYKIRNRSIDIIQVERKFYHACRRIDQLMEELDEFKNILFDEKECGLTIKELYLTSDLNADTVNIKQEYQFFNFQDIHEFVRKLKVYSNYASWFDNEDYLWKRRKSFARFQSADQKNILKIIADIPKYQEHVSSLLENLIGTKINLEDGRSFLAREIDVLGMIAVLNDDDIYRYFQTIIGETDDETSLLWLSNTERVISNCFEGLGPEVTVPNEQLGQVQLALQQCVEARQNIISRIHWEFFSQTKFFLKRVLVANNLPYNKVGMTSLEERIDNRLNLEHHLTALRKKSWLVEIPSAYDEQKFEEWFHKQKLAIRAKLNFSSLREVKKGINVSKYTRKQFINLMKQLLEAVSGIPEKEKEWSEYLSPYQIKQLILEPILEQQFVKTLKKDFDNLCDFDRLDVELKSYEKEVIVKLYDFIGEWDAERMAILFQNSIRLAWIDHIETKFPILRSVSSLRMEETQKELQEQVNEKENLSKEILLLRARERLYEHMEYNRLNNPITYRDLLHQVSKKKKIWPVRKVVKEFQDELFQLVPCWLASPESVSAIFPMVELFDLVIFDEASQCFAERGVPAMYRGKQMVIAGDDKQLRPSELYQVRWDEDEENPDQEVDSLLELTERYLSTVHLQGHYRSKSLELIDFSNRNFYDGRLRLLPDKNIINQQKRGIEYCKVEGVWENHVNEVEAKAVVEKVLAIVTLQPEKEIGVVTFNAPQQMLVMDYLEEAFVNAGARIPSTLFVKNIENVQGDEKDIIIFSIGYAPDKKNKMAMQFGSLNMSGGENRLNVAVTRAREKIILISSIWPEQLKTEGVKNEGPKLLRKYLEYARDVDQGKFTPQFNEQNGRNASWYLNSRLKEWGENKFESLVFEPDTLPFSDLNFKIDNRHLGIILTDDTRYFTSFSAKEIYAYTPALLANKNWSYRMVFSRNFWQNRQKIEDELSIFIGTKI